MELRMYQIDAFADRLFSGNPAAVCPLESWLPDEVMQQIAAENNLAETAFYIRHDGGFDLRWFTPAVEVDLCGHATLAAAHVVFTHDCFPHDTIQFTSKSGILRVRRDGDRLVLDFPVDTVEPVTVPQILIDALGREPIESYRGKTDYMLVYGVEEHVAGLTPDLVDLATVPARGIIVTAPGRQVDFVSRFFAPQVGVPEDPVTGSAHTTLTPYWAARLGKNELTARQLSKRQGSLRCTLVGNRVDIAGRAVPYLEGTITI
ncbi:MAG TPA: PhzF family phenazine biosynthesis protein [Vicinamibacterales bacterium]|jgi:PhzF family phenazine biosynthesis protein